MLTPEERALITDMQDQLIELYVAKDEAAGREDWGRMHEPEQTIDHVSERCGEIRKVADEAG
jgi:hypothetical protein